NSLSVMDKWLLSRLNTVVKQVDENLDNYRIPESARALQDFVDEMSNWYVRRCRERFWQQGMSKDKINAYMTLYTALVTIAKTSAPLIPFMSEDIYRNLVCSVDKNAPVSVHLCSFPAADEKLIDKQLEEDMNEALNIVVLGRAARNGSNIKNRQPLSKMFVKADSELSEYFVEIIEDELNVKEVDFSDDVSSFMSYSFKPQLKTLGPKYGKQLGEIRNYLAEIDGSAAKAELDNTGKLVLKLSGTDIEVTEEDLLIDIKQKEGYFTLSDSDVTVALDINLTDELIEEGFVREIISKIQTMRKDAGFEVMDHINIGVTDNQKIGDLMNKNADEIKKDVLAENISDTISGFDKEWNINGEKVKLSVEKV
ncbi:MAG: class I tRNA ligase family protein, partial [Clostridia bacterium]|nr:class I tRNA ligase family protein [Clostridia bacterium]